MFVAPLARLVEEFEKMPGIGKKTATRLAFYVLGLPKEKVGRLAGAITEAKEKIGFCSVCQDLTDRDPCRLCSSPKREQQQICIVESPKDVISIEKTREYNGLYHVLHGAISPIDGVGPDDIKLMELLGRLKEQSVDEVIMATNPNVEGEATAMYIAQIIRPFCKSITRLAHGIPVGGDLEFADEITLSRALAGRNEI